MITFCNGDFEATRDKYQWVLTRWVDGKDKDGNLKRKAVETYHASLKQVCNTVLDKVGDKCSTTDDMLCLLENAQELLHSKAEDIICRSNESIN